MLSDWHCQSRRRYIRLYNLYILINEILYKRGDRKLIRSVLINGMCNLKDGTRAARRQSAGTMKCTQACAKLSLLTVEFVLCASDIAALPQLRNNRSQFFRLSLRGTTNVATWQSRRQPHYTLRLIPTLTLGMTKGWDTHTRILQNNSPKQDCKKLQIWQIKLRMFASFVKNI